jgi:hypothetical protein
MEKHHYRRDSSCQAAARKTGMERHNWPTIPEKTCFLRDLRQRRDSGAGNRAEDGNSIIIRISVAKSTNDQNEKTPEIMQVWIGKC